MPSVQEPDLASAGVALLIIFGLLIWYDKPVESARPFDPYIQHQDLQATGYSYESWLWQDPFGFDLDSYTERNQYYIEFGEAEKIIPYHFRVNKKTDIEPVGRKTETALKKESEENGKEVEVGKTGSGYDEGYCEYQLKKRIDGNGSDSETSTETPIRNSVKILAPLLKVRPNTTENKELRTRQRYAVIAGLIESGYHPLEPNRLHFCSSQKTDRKQEYDVRWERYHYESKAKPEKDITGKLNKKPDIIVVWTNSEIFKNDDNELTFDKFVSGFENLLTEETYIYDLNRIFDLEYQNKITCKNILLITPVGLHEKPPPKECLEKQATESTEKLPEESKKQRAITGDLAKKLSDELTLRNVKEPSDVMIITEQDSENARALAKNFCKFYSDPSVKDKQDTNVKDKLNADDPKDNICEIKKIRNIFYLKGLDAYQQTLHKQNKNEDQVNKPAARLSAIDLNVPPPLPIGPSQFDYFHRLAKQINDVHKEINLKTRDSGVKAVGIFGSDFYDKLLILEALRAEMPNILVFTTELDAQMLHSSHWLSTRNLVVASDFDLLLKEKDKDDEEQYQKQSYQKQFPVFRDSRQTNIFYRTIEIVTNDVTGYEIPSSQIFEIGRNGPVRFLEEKNEGLKLCLANAMNQTTSLLRSWINLFDDSPIQGKLLSLFPQDQTKLRLLLVAGIGVFLVFLHWSLRPGPESQLLSKQLLVCIAALFLSAWFFATGESGEPLSLDGISLWPTILTQLFAMLLAFGCFYWCRRQLDINFCSLSRQYFPVLLTQENFPVCLRKSEWKLSECDLVTLRALILIFSLIFYVWNDVSPSTLQFITCLLLLILCLIIHRRNNIQSNDFVSIKNWMEKDNFGSTERHSALQFENYESCVWWEYSKYGQIDNRGDRVVAIWLFFAIIETILIYLLPPWPLPCRGYTCSWVSGIGVLSFSVIMILLFFVLDAIRLNICWIKKLRTQHPMLRERVSEKLLDAFRSSQRMGGEQFDSFRISQEHFDAFNKAVTNYPLRSLEKIVDMVAERTGVVDKLIYYPMLCIMLMLFARITYFDNQDFPLSKGITFAVSISLLFFAGFMLRSEAEKLKGSVIQCAESLGKNNGLDQSQVNSIIERIKEIDEGAFESMFEQPVLRALLIILASIGLFAGEYLKLFE